MLKNWKELFLSVTYFVVIGVGVRYLFILTPHLYLQVVTTKHPREKPGKYPRE